MAKKLLKNITAPKAVAGVCVALLAILLIAFAVVNIFVRAAYAPFYGDAERRFDIPGISQGFIPQDLDNLANGTWLFSGYMTDGGDSPVFMRKADGTEGSFTVLREDGTVDQGHGSGITSDDERVFLTDDQGILAISLRDVESVADGGQVKAVGSRDLDFGPAFLNIENGVLLTGNFYRAGNYETPDHHRMDSPSGDHNPAVLFAYPADEFGEYGYADEPSCVYSIPERIQGVCMTDTGQIVLSQSYGLATSNLLVYSEPADSGMTYDHHGAQIPIRFLDSDSLLRVVEAPPMTEGIEWHAGRVWISCESASDKYIFGKLYGAAAVYSLNLGLVSR